MWLFLDLLTYPQGLVRSEEEGTAVATMILLQQGLIRLFFLHFPSFQQKQNEPLSYTHGSVLHAGETGGNEYC